MGKPQGGGGVLGISSDRDDQMEPEVKTQKYPLSFQQNPKKSLDQKLTPKKSHLILWPLQVPERNNATGHADYMCIWHILDNMCDVKQHHDTM